MITYFIGCFWWFIVRNFNTMKDEIAMNTFITSNELDMVFDSSTDFRCGKIDCTNNNETYCKNHDSWRKENCEHDVLTQAIIVCYFALTTLSTIGYGDLYPLSSREMILGIIFMLIGIVFFS